MKRILILGSAGAGKSYLAKKLGNLLDLEVIHLDYYFWQPGWQIPDRDVWEQTVSELVKKNRWVMDGNYNRTLKLRLSYADTVIFLEADRITCLKRCFLRFLKYRGKTRPDLNQECPELFDLEFMKWIWIYPNKVKPEILGMIEDFKMVKFIELKGKKEFAGFLKRTKSDTGN